MNNENKKNLKGLSAVSEKSGLFAACLGVVLMFFAGFNKNPLTLSIGLLIFIMGYAFMKIGQKINKNISQESKKE